MSEGTGQWRPEGSGQSRVSAALSQRAWDIRRAERAFLDHVRECGSCYVDGVDCETAVGLREAWRAAQGTHSNHGE